MKRTEIELTIELVAAVAIETAGLVGYYAPIRLAGWSGDYAIVERTVSPGVYATRNVRFVDNQPDWTDIRAWNGGGLAGVTMVQAFDQSGAGNLAVAATRSEQPMVTDVVAQGGHIPICVDGNMQQAATTKALQIVFATPLDRANFSVVQAFRARVPTGSDSYFEGFQGADFTSGGLSGVSVFGLGDAFGHYGASVFQAWQQRVRSHVTTMSYSSGPTGAAGAPKAILRMQESEKDFGDTVTSVPIRSMRFGKHSSGVNAISGMDIFGLLIYAVGKTSAQLQAIEGVLNDRLGIRRTGWKHRVISGHNSLSHGHSSSLNQNPAAIAGLGRSDGELRNVEFINLAITGRTLVAEANAANQRAWHIDGDDPTKDVNVLVIGEPANDATPANGGSGHADKAAADSFDNLLLPYGAAWIAKGQTAIQTIMANRPFIADNAANLRGIRDRGGRDPLHGGECGSLEGGRDGHHAWLASNARAKVCPRSCDAAFSFMVGWSPGTQASGQVGGTGMVAEFQGSDLVKEPIRSTAR